MRMCWSMQSWTPFWELPRWETSVSIFRIPIRNIKGISSIALLKEVGALLEAEGYVIENIDATIIAQRPKLAAYRPQMAENIADALHLELNQVSEGNHRRRGLDSPEVVRAFLPRPSRCFPICVTLRQMTVGVPG